MINQNVTNVLQQINGITNSVILKHPTTIVNSPAGDIVVRIDIDELDSEPFADIGVYNLSEFLNTFKLFGDKRTVDIQEKNITVQEGNTLLQYISTNTSLLSDFDKSEDLFTKTEEVSTVAEFQVSSDDIKKLKQASGVFKDLNELSIVSQDGGINVAIGASNNFNAKSNGYSISLSGETSKEFTVKLPIENFNVLPNSTYNVYVKYNSARDAYRIIFGSTEINMKILLAVKK